MRWISAVVFLISVPSYSEYSFQQQWTDGPGYPGPVHYWSEGFWQSSGVAWWEFDPSWDGPHRIGLIHYHLKPVETGFEGVSALDPCDIDGDGDPDLTGASSTGGEVVWWRNDDGQGTAWSRITVDDDVPGAIPVQGADIDGDGSMDLVGASRYDHLIVWWRNQDGTGTSWNRQTILGGYLFPVSVNAVDIDGDGDPDMVCSSGYPNAIIWMENTDGSGGSWKQHSVSESVLLTRTMEVCDIDGDSDPDVLASISGPDISWWENVDGTGTSWLKHTIELLYFCMDDIAAADVDGDGDADVVGTNDTGSWKVNWWKNLDGAGTQWQRVAIGGQSLNEPGSSSIHPQDFDGDGSMDVVAASADENTVKVWMNRDGIGTNWGRAYIQGAFYGAGSATTTDFDADGNPEVVALATDLATVAWWRDSTYTESGWLESSIDENSTREYDMLRAWCETPPGTSVQFQLRASDDPDSMGSWSDTLVAPCNLSGVLPENGSGEYLQYRIILSTQDPEVTPYVDGLFVYWTSVGIGEETPEVGEGISGPLVNPSVGPVTVRFSVMEATLVSFSLYDISGRVVKSVTVGSYQVGEHDLVFSGLTPGTYTLRMQTEKYTDTCRIVVLGP